MKAPDERSSIVVGAMRIAGRAQTRGGWKRKTPAARKTAGLRGFGVKPACSELPLAINYCVWAQADSP